MPLNRLGLVAIALALTAVPGLGAATCTVGAGNVSFGAVNPLDHVDTDITAQVTLNCTPGDRYTVTLSSGYGSVAQREMRSDANVLPYNLYQDPDRSIVWGDGTAGTVPEGTGSGADTTLNIYGRVPSNPLAVPGTYADSVIMTLILQ